MKSPSLIGMTNETAWPTMTRETGRAWQEDLATAANTASRVRSKLRAFAGGGVPAHKLREAEILLDEARDWIEEALAEAQP